MKFSIPLGSILLTLIISSPILAQGARLTRHRLECSGYFFNKPVRISGIRQLRESWGRGGYVTFVNFEGRMQSQQGTAGLIYENTQGVLLTTPPMSLVILDNTGGKMMIYDGRPTLGAPQQLGQLLCKWIPQN